MPWTGLLTLLTFGATHATFEYYVLLIHLSHLIFDPGAVSRFALPMLQAPGS
jgi:hypothetical protein